MYNSYHLRCSHVVPLWCKSPHKYRPSIKKITWLKMRNIASKFQGPNIWKKNPKRGGERENIKREEGQHCMRASMSCCILALLIRGTKIIAYFLLDRLKLMHNLSPIIWLKYIRFWSGHKLPKKRMKEKKWFTSAKFLIPHKIL